MVALPSMKHSHVKSIVTYDGALQEAFPPVTVEEEFIPAKNNKTKGYVKGVYEKLDVSDRVTATTEAYRRGFLRRD